MRSLLSRIFTAPFRLFHRTDRLDRIAMVTTLGVLLPGAIVVLHDMRDMASWRQALIASAISLSASALGFLIRGLFGWIERVRKSVRSAMSPSGPRTVRRAAFALDVLSCLVSQRIANEEVGDAMESILKLVAAERPKWLVYLKVAATWVRALWHSACDVAERVAAIIGKARRGEKDKD